MDNVKAAEQFVHALDNNRNDSSPPISVVNGPATHTGANRDGTRFRNIVAVRARSLRVSCNQGLHVDDDTVRLVESSPSNHLVKYTEKILRQDGTVEERTL
jgi:hypothetical protein